MSALTLAAAVIVARKKPPAALRVHTDDRSGVVRTLPGPASPDPPPG